MLPQLQPVPMREIDTVAGGTAAFGVIDTKGFDYATLLYLTAAATAASSQDKLNLAEDDTEPTAFTDATEVDGFDGANDYTIVAESTTKSNVYQFNVDLRGRKRFLAMEYESDATHSGCMLACLMRKHVGPPETVATTLHGVRNIVNG